jgi:hypothetical protein
LQVLVLLGGDLSLGDVAMTGPATARADRIREALWWPITENLNGVICSNDDPNRKPCPSCAHGWDELRAAIELLPPGSIVIVPDDKCVVLTADEVETLEEILCAYVTGDKESDEACDEALALLGGTDEPDVRTLGERGEVKGATWNEIQ